MTREGYDKIEQWLRDHKYLRNPFYAKIREGLSLRHLQTWLEANGCKVSVATLSNYVKTLDLEIRKQRELERNLKKKSPSAINKVREFFSSLTGETFTPIGCEHKVTERFFDMASEKVCIKCSSCGKLLASYDPEEHEKRMEKDPRNWKLLEALQKSRKSD